MKYIKQGLHFTVGLIALLSAPVTITYAIYLAYNGFTWGLLFLVAVPLEFGALIYLIEGVEKK